METIQPYLDIALSYMPASVCDAMTSYNAVAAAFGPLIGFKSDAMTLNASITMASIGALLLLTSRCGLQKIPFFLMAIVFAIVATAPYFAGDTAGPVGDATWLLGLAGLTFDPSWGCYYVLGAEVLAMIVTIFLMCTASFGPILVGALVWATMVYLLLGALTNGYPYIVPLIPGGIPPSVSFIGDFFTTTADAKFLLILGGAAALGGLLGKLMFASTSATDGAFGVVGTALLAQSIVQFFLLYLPEYAAMGMVAELFVAYIFGVYIVLNIFRANLPLRFLGILKKNAIYSV